VFAGFGQQWRRNIRTSERLDVEVVTAGANALDTFHDIYVTTAARDGFTPRPRAYFPRMWEALNADLSRSPAAVAAGDGTPGGGAPAPTPGRPEMRLYLARHRGTVLAASITVRVGDHSWYVYGASGDHDRRLKPSNALQWRMLSDAHAAGATVYDLRGIGGSLDADAPLFGLTRFKLGSGGRAVEYLGEWELPVNRLLHRAVGAYLARR
jgi:lipid II:glycine glycyltransferase (peptidoglycan interpeptide bridge formation enzyme)